MVVRTVALLGQVLVPAATARHKARGPSDWAFGPGLLVESLHAELAHVPLSQRNSGIVEQPLDLRKAPRSGAPWVLMEEMLPLPKLSLV